MSQSTTDAPRRLSAVSDQQYVIQQRLINSNHLTCYGNIQISLGFWLSCAVHECLSYQSMPYNMHSRTHRQSYIKPQGRSNTV